MARDITRPQTGKRDARGHYHLHLGLGAMPAASRTRFLASQLTETVEFCLNAKMSTLRGWLLQVAEALLPMRKVATRHASLVGKLTCSLPERRHTWRAWLGTRSMISG